MTPTEQQLREAVRKLMEAVIMLEACTLKHSASQATITQRLLADTACLLAFSEIDDPPDSVR